VVTDVSSGGDRRGVRADHLSGAPTVVGLDDPRATDAALTGAKAANLARCAARGLPTLPGFVLTTTATEALDGGSPLTDAVRDELAEAWERLSGEVGEPLIVRSSSTAEDLEQSSMAGQFVSVLDVAGWDRFVAAVHAVLRSAERDPAAGGVARPMAVLVQRQLDVEMGGVLFGVDPLTGDRDRVVVEVVPSRVDDLVSGKVTAAHYVLTRRGRVVDQARPDAAPELTVRMRHRLAALARDAAAALGPAQDVEWAVDQEGRLWLLQSRPVTAVAERAGSDRVFGPGPLAETFPRPLRRLEQDLWVVPLREGVERALRASGAVSESDLESSPIVVAVGGRAAMDLELTGIVAGTSTIRRRINPVQILRRLLTSWRVGRLRVALPRLSEKLLVSVDADLCAVPPVDRLATETVVDLLERTRRELATVHQYEVLAGMLLHDRTDAVPAALVALNALHEARDRGLSDDEALRRWPVLLSLTPPTLSTGDLPHSAPVPSHERRSIEVLDEREALRLRSRWLQELLAIGVRSLAWRLAENGTLAAPALVRELSIEELSTAARRGELPDDLDVRSRTPDGPPLPSRFRLTPSGEALPVDVDRDETFGLPAAPGRIVGVARHRITPGSGKGGHVLVTQHLDPALAPLLPSLDGLVSETGSALSHLAILAREMGVVAVVGVDDARRRFPPGTPLVVDGGIGEVRRMAGGDADDVTGEVR
jgi:phosphohistidine swiveling domain-containing protein